MQNLDEETHLSFSENIQLSQQGFFLSVNFRTVTKYLCESEYRNLLIQDKIDKFIWVCFPYRKKYEVYFFGNEFTFKFI